MDEFEQWMAERARTNRRLWIGAAVLGALGGGVALAFRSADHLRDWRSGRTDLWGRPVHVRWEGSRAGDVDWETVCVSRIPDWWLALAHREDSQADVRTAWSALQADLAPVPELGSVFEEMHTLASADPVGNAKRLLELAAWGARQLDTLKAPCWFTGTVMDNGESSFFYLKTYRVTGDFTATVGERTHRVRLLARADRTNVVEGWLGSVQDGEDGALILTDRIQDFVTDTLWPALAQESTDPWAPVLDAVAQALLPPDAMERIHATAALRQRMIRAVDAIRERERCGSNFRVAWLPWDGFNARTQRNFEDAAREDAFAACPMVTPEEAEALMDGSRALQGDADLREAIGALVALASRSIVVHELRHVADDGTVPCVQCPAFTSDDVAAEASAYLASLADPDQAPLALYQACDANRGAGGDHAEALGWIRLALLPEGCGVPPAPDLPARAAELERTWFGRSDPTTLPADYPTTLPLRRMGE